MVNGRVVAIEKEAAVVDIGFKSEGRVPLKEFTPPDKKPSVGDTVEVFFEQAENKFGDAVLSRERAKREAAWTLMEKALNNKEKVKGYIVSRVKGGFSVDLSDVIAFLPGSQVDVKVIKDNSYLIFLLSYKNCTLTFMPLSRIIFEYFLIFKNLLKYFLPSDKLDTKMPI